MAGRDYDAIIRRIRVKVQEGDLRLTQHAHQEMVEEDIALAEVLEAMATGRILEDYPQHRRGPCCLIWGETVQGRPLHVVCTTDLPSVVIITAYEPRPPKWVTPFQRGETR